MKESCLTVRDRSWDTGCCKSISVSRKNFYFSSSPDSVVRRRVDLTIGWKFGSCSIECRAWSNRLHEILSLGLHPDWNLFSQTAEPIRLSHTSTEYQVFPDIRRQNATEVYSIDSVTSVSPGSDDVIEFEPFLLLQARS